MNATLLSQPARLGEACWTDESVTAAIRVIAQVDPAQSDWFIASHAPIRHLHDVRADQFITEIDAFKELSRATDREVEVLVKGEPGTGKSHLINWLKLRYDEGVHTGELDGVVPVLIQRRSGSLKDALDQLIAQLPAQFGQYLDPVKAAISRISEAQARERLCHFVAQELDIHWTEPGQVPRERRLRALNEAFWSTGFRQWLCRDGGLIAANVNRLISPSDARDRETEAIPQFTGAEFEVRDPRFRLENTPQVLLLLDTFDDDPRSRETAAKYCNEVLREALLGMTGLGDRQLTEIFRSIRSDLRRMKKRLVLFIEDVSTLSVLDHEIVNAVEPQNDARLCPLTSVIGMTFPAFERLRENEKQRATHIWSLGGSNDSTWRANAETIDKFVGRYLNTVRLTRDSIALVAGHRRSGRDVDLSACDECLIKEKCHETFGTVQFDGATVGLFPLQSGTAGLLLEQLDDSRLTAEKTPRGLLTGVLDRLLRDVLERRDGVHPPLKLPVRVSYPSYWTAFEHEYCGDWTADDKRRVRMLAAFWTGARDKEEVAATLARLLDPFALPKFSRSVEPRPDRPREPKPPEPRPPSPPDTDAIETLRARLDKWLSGDRLTHPREAQELLLGFLKNGLPFDDARLTARASHRLLRDAQIGTIRIEDSATRAAAVHFGIDFPRSEETADLILALAHFRHVGGNSWRFADAEIHKRRVSLWLRRNERRLLSALDAPGLDRNAPVRAAARVLAIAYMATRRSGLPPESSQALECLLNLSRCEPPQALSAPLRQLYGDLPERVASLQKFLHGELDIPQGTGGTLFVDQTTLMADLAAIRAAESPEALGPEYLKGFSQSRYDPIRPLIEGPWSRLREAVASERSAIAKVVEQCEEMLGRLGLDPENLDGAVVDLLNKALELRRVLSRVGHAVPIDAFETLVPNLGLRRDGMASLLKRSRGIVDQEDVKDVLTFDVAMLEETKAAIGAAATYIDTVGANIRRATADQVSMEEIDIATRGVLEKLKAIEIEALS